MTKKITVTIINVSCYWCFIYVLVFVCVCLFVYFLAVFPKERLLIDYI